MKMNDNQLLAFADSLDSQAEKLNARAEAEPFTCEEEAAEYIWTCATAGTVAMLISAAIRDVVKGPKLPSGIH